LKHGSFNIPKACLHRYHNVYDDILPIARILGQHGLWNATNPQERVIVFLNPEKLLQNAAFEELLSLHFGTVLLDVPAWKEWLRGLLPDDVAQ
jgi:hypothetical protein